MHTCAYVQAVPLLSVIEDLVKQRQQGSNAPLIPSGVRFIWTSREREEFTLISETIMAAARYGMIMVMIRVRVMVTV